MNFYNLMVYCSIIYNLLFYICFLQTTDRVNASGPMTISVRSEPEQLSQSGANLLRDVAMMYHDVLSYSRVHEANLFYVHLREHQTVTPSVSSVPPQGAIIVNRQGK